MYENKMYCDKFVPCKLRNVNVNFLKHNLSFKYLKAQSDIYSFGLDDAIWFKEEQK